jgi:hypothetical protein
MGFITRENSIKNFCYEPKVGTVESPVKFKIERTEERKKHKQKLGDTM